MGNIIEHMWLPGILWAGFFVVKYVEPCEICCYYLPALSLAGIGSIIVPPESLDLSKTVNNWLSGFYRFGSCVKCVVFILTKQRHSLT